MVVLEKLLLTQIFNGFKKNKIMKDKLISFETAKLAKEKGFENKTPHKLRRDYYNHLGEVNGDVTDYLRAYVHKKDTSKLLTVDAPTQSLLQRWLREVHNIDVEVRKCGELYKKLYEQGRGKKCLKYYGVIILESGEDFTIGDDGFTSDSYEEILKTGLPEALKLMELPKVKSKLNPCQGHAEYTEEQEANSEERMKIIGQNGPSALHYGEEDDHNG
jgi:hypothetical protein